MRIGILGLGLIGGSFALATRQRTGHRVCGWDSDARTMEQALKDGAIEEILTPDMLPTLDLLLLGVVPHVAVEYIRANAQGIRGLVMDLCGVKRAVSGEILPLSREYGFRYIGGHPMAGRERGGYANALPTLFHNCAMILVPHDGGIPEEILEYIRALGFDRVEVSEDDRHDRIIAFSSQLAHLVSTNYCKAKTAPEHWGYSADSLRDMTRVATLNPVMWSELFIANKDNLIQEAQRLIQDMETMVDALRREDQGELTKLLEEGRQAKDRMYPRGVEWEESR